MVVDTWFHLLDLMPLPPGAINSRHRGTPHRVDPLTPVDPPSIAPMMHAGLPPPSRYRHHNNHHGQRRRLAGAPQARPELVSQRKLAWG